MKARHWPVAERRGTALLNLRGQCWSFEDLMWSIEPAHALWLVGIVLE